MKMATPTAPSRAKTSTLAAILLDRLGERLAFARTSSHLFEAMLAKYDARGSWQGGPSREQLEQFLGEEVSHFLVLRGAIEELGGDPTAMTPLAGLADVAAQGLLTIVTDPRTSLVQALEALLIAELADAEGWALLVKLLTSAGMTATADECEEALGEELHHVESVRAWLRAHVIGAAMPRIYGGESRS